jgi:hypothetical protein
MSDVPTLLPPISPCGQGRGQRKTPIDEVDDVCVTTGSGDAQEEVGVA